MGEGPAIVILHGLFGSSDNWGTFGRMLSEKGYSAYLVDLRNHGKSPHDSEFNYRIMSDDLHKFIEQEKLTNPVIIGHSMGGKVAMTYCLNYPGNASALVVVDISPRYYEPNHQHIVAALQYADPASCTSRKEAEARLQEKLNDPGMVQFLAKNLYWNEHNKLDWRFYLDGIAPNIESIGEAISGNDTAGIHALFTRGERSDYITGADELEIKKLFKNSEIVTVAGAGHWVHADQPGALLDHLLAFISHGHL